MKENDSARKRIRGRSSGRARVLTRTSSIDHHDREAIVGLDDRKSPKPGDLSANGLCGTGSANVSCRWRTLAEPVAHINARLTVH